MEKPETISTSFRLPKTTVEQLEALATLLKESKTDVIARAVKRLYADRETVVKEDYEDRMGIAKK